MANILNLQTGDDTPDEMGRVVGSIPRDPNRAREIGDKISASRNEELSPDASTNQSAFIRDARERAAQKTAKAKETQEEQTTNGTGQSENSSVAKAGKAIGGVGKALEATGVGAELGAGLQAAGKALEVIKNPFKAAQEKFGTGTVYLMVGTALLIDGINFITFGIASYFGSDLIAGMTFWLWFRIKGAKFGKKRTLALLGGFIADLIPIVNMLPDWTLAICLSFFEESLDSVLGELPGAGIIAKATGTNVGESAGEALKKAA